MVNLMTHLLRPCRREEEGLAARGDVVQDFPNLRLEAHVQHSIRLIEDKVVALLQRHQTTFQKVIQATRGGDYDVHAVANVAELTALRCPPEDAGGTEPAGSAEFVALDLYLLCEFPGGGEDEDARVYVGCM